MNYKYSDSTHKSEHVTLEVKRWYIEGRPTCVSWAENPLECCNFLHNDAFCVLLDTPLYFDDEEIALVPDRNCPLWNNNPLTTSNKPV